MLNLVTFGVLASCASAYSLFPGGSGAGLQSVTMHMVPKENEEVSRLATLPSFDNDKCGFEDEGGHYFDLNALQKASRCVFNPS